MLTRLYQRPTFVILKRLSLAKASFKCGLHATSNCARLQHNPNQLNLKTNSSTNEIVDEGRDKKILDKVKPIFSSKQITKSAQIFEMVAVKQPNEDGFNEAIESLKKRDVKRLKTMEIVKTSLSYMDVFGVSTNIESYNKLLDIFPKGRYQNKSVFDTLWTRYRPQIDCAVQVLTKMEENGVRPNVTTYDIVHAVFGNDGIPLNKLRRIVFWFDKFDEMYPDPLPRELPSDKQDLFKIAILRMTGGDFMVTSYKSSDGDKHIVAAQSKAFPNFLADYDLTKPMFVEGPHIVWLRKNKIHYYTLQADMNPNLSEEDHILGICILDETDGEAELNTWIRKLQKSFPKLSELNIVFNIHSTENNKF